MIGQAQLSNRRYVTAGTRAYIVGLQDGSFPPLGWHIAGEMGGLWAPPLKLLDGLKLEIQGEPLPPASKFYRFPEKVQFDHHFSSQQLFIRLTEFVPDGIPGGIFHWHIKNLSPQQKNICVLLKICVHPILCYPWCRNSQEKQKNAHFFIFNSQVEISSENLYLIQVPEYHRYVAVTVDPAPQRFERLPARSFVEYCEFHEYESAVMVGQLKFTLLFSPMEEKTLTLAIAGSLLSKEEALMNVQKLIQNYDTLLVTKKDDYEKILTYSQLKTPDEQLNKAFSFNKINLRMATLEIPDLGRGIVAGYPDYPWWFANDGAFTIPALLTVGQFELAKEHLLLVAKRSQEVNQRSGKIVHEIAPDGTVYFGFNQDPGNTSETAQFAYAVYLTWLWSGDDLFLRKLYPVIKTGLLDWLAGTQMDSDGLPLGYGNDEEPDWGPKRLDVACYCVQAFQALTHMAHYLKDTTTAKCAENLSYIIKESINRYFWLENFGLYAHSISTDSMEPLEPFGSPVPMESCVAPPEKAWRSFQRLEQADFNTTWGYGHPTWLRKYTPMTIATGIMAIAEANYGRINQSIEYIKKIARHVEVELPGALPEFAPPYPLNEYPLWKPNFLQVWGSYGLHWPLIHHVLGIRPRVPESEISILPHLPSNWQHLSVKKLRIGQHFLNVLISCERNFYEVLVENAMANFKFVLGLILSNNKRIKNVTLNRSRCTFHSNKMWEQHQSIWVEFNNSKNKNLQLKIEIENEA